MSIFLSSAHCNYIPTTSQPSHNPIARISPSVSQRYQSHVATISQPYPNQSTTIPQVSQRHGNRIPTISQPYPNLFRPISQDCRKTSQPYHCRNHIPTVSQPHHKVSHSHRNRFPTIFQPYHSHVTATTSQPYPKSFPRYGRGWKMVVVWLGYANRITATSPPYRNHIPIVSQPYPNHISIVQQDVPYPTIPTRAYPSYNCEHRIPTTF